MSLPREGEVRIPSGCAVSGMFSKSGKRMNGEQIIRSIEVMHDRSNGLGGGFAAYGIYPEYKEYYAFHIFYDDISTKQECERFLEHHFDIINLSKIPTRKMPQITDVPLIWRYFVTPLPTKLAESQLDEREFVAKCVFHINTRIKGSYVFSSGKNMGVFKAVGFPEDVGRFYRLDEYAGYCFTAHGRYPTNTPGWWGGAHPFALLDYTVVHNGEISSYDANRRAIENVRLQMYPPDGYGGHCLYHRLPAQKAGAELAGDLLRHRCPLLADHRGDAGTGAEKARIPAERICLPADYRPLLHSGGL